MKKILKYLIYLFLTTTIILSIPEIIHKNEGISLSTGSVGNGQLKNPYLLPFWGNNYKYFSFISYYFMDNGYMNSKVHETLISTYKKLEKLYPDTEFVVMECADKKGGKLLLHKTHQSGMSVDFMSPKKSSSWLTYDNLGMFHYLLEFDEDGKLSFDNSVEIDFELMAQHILILNQVAKKNGIRIKKVILKIDLKDNLFVTESGKKLKSQNIYFAKSLPDWTNKMHDDHYHIDFEEIR